MVSFVSFYDVFSCFTMGGETMMPSVATGYGGQNYSMIGGLERLVVKA
jgi:hypothetical protein